MKSILPDVVRRGNSTSRPELSSRLLIPAVLLLAVVAFTACEGALVEAPVAPRGVQVIAVPTAEFQAQIRIPTSLRVRVVNEDGRPVRSASVRYDVLTGAGLFSADSTLTNDQGFSEVLFLPFTAGTVIVEASSGQAGAGRARFTILVFNDPDEAAVLEEVGGDDQSGPAGTVLPLPLVVRVLNPDGLPVDAHPVVFILQQSAGEFAGLSPDRGGFFSGQITVSTDASGVARAFLLLGTAAGSHSVSAHATTGPTGAQTTESVTFTAEATPVQASQLVILSGDNQTAVIDTLHEEDSPDFRGRAPNPLVVQALDRFGTPVAGVAVQWRVSDGGGTVVSATTFTDANGVTENVVEDVTEGRNAIVAFAAGTNAVEFVITGQVLEPPPPPDEGGGGG